MDYGKTEFENDAEKTIQCRQIVKEIIDFGVSDFQKLKIMELLSLELENRNHMLQIIDAIKNLSEIEKEQKKKLITLE